MKNNFGLQFLPVILEYLQEIIEGENDEKVFDLYYFSLLNFERLRN